METGCETDTDTTRVVRTDGGDDLDEQLQEFADDLATLDLRPEHEQERNDGDLKRLETEIERLRNELNSLEIPEISAGEWQAVRNGVESLSNNMKTVGKEIQSLKQTVSELEATEPAAEPATAETLASLEALEADVAALTSKVDGLEEPEPAVTEEELESLEADVGALESAFESNIAALNSKIDGLEEPESAVTKDALESVRADIDALEGALDGLRADVEQYAAATTPEETDQTAELEALRSELEAVKTAQTANGRDESDADSAFLPPALAGTGGGGVLAGAAIAASGETTFGAVVLIVGVILLGVSLALRT